MLEIDCDSLRNKQSPQIIATLEESARTFAKVVSREDSTTCCIRQHGDGPEYPMLIHGNEHGRELEDCDHA